MTRPAPRNLGLDLVRVTEATAIAAGRWMGLGQRDQADRDASDAMHDTLNELDIDGRIVIGEETKLEIDTPLDSGRRVGAGNGLDLDVVVDPIEGLNLLAQGLPGSIAVAGMAPRGTMRPLAPAVYMEKIVVDRDAAEALVPECMDAPAAWTLALVARVKQKRVRDLVVFMLDRPRHQDLIEEIRAAGARVMLQPEGDVAGAILAASPHHQGVDLLMDTGGVPEGVIAACAIKAMGGAMLGRLAPQSDEERTAVQNAELDTQRIFTADDLVASNDIFFAATGITDGPLLDGVRYRGNKAETESLILRCETGTRRLIYAEHLVD